MDGDDSGEKRGQLIVEVFLNINYVGDELALLTRAVRNVVWSTLSGNTSNEQIKKRNRINYGVGLDPFNEMEPLS